MSIDWQGLIISLYIILAVAYLTWISLDRTVTRNWHMVLALTIFLPVTACLIAFNLAVMALGALRRWAMKEV